MPNNMFISQPAPRSPVTDFLCDKTDFFGLKQSSRESVKGGRDNFLNTLKEVIQDRVSNKWLKFTPDESSPVMDVPIDAREKGEASPEPIAPDWNYMAVVQVLKNMGFNDAIGGADLQGMISGNHLHGRRGTPIKRLIARLRRNQTIRKVTTHFRNGRNEAIIDFKSDYLGHIRMQVISKKQQVTVRILAEHDFVKNMIAGDLHQLKADLQQQGLAVDEMEVTVFGDPDNSGSIKEKFTPWRARPATADHRENDDWQHKPQKGTRQPPRTANNAVVVDYFA